MTAPRPMRASRRAPFEIGEYLALALLGEGILEPDAWSAWTVQRDSGESYREHAIAAPPDCPALAFDPDPDVAIPATRALLTRAEEMVAYARATAGRWSHPRSHDDAADAACWRRRLAELEGAA